VLDGSNKMMHIFLLDVKQEIRGSFDFLAHVYGIFGFTFRLELSTRPEQHLGTVEMWDKAEAELAEVLNENYKGQWKVNPGDGAFYGPKIDIHVQDALGRSHQCATIQLDFQLPKRFKLEYIQEDGSAARPVIIHRAICGSVERFLAILIEHTGGKWPFWISPRQCIVLPIVGGLNDYAIKIKNEIQAAGFYCDVDESDNKINKKILNAQTNQFNFILVVGNREEKNGTVNVRTRDNQVHGEKSIDQLLADFAQLIAGFK